MESDKQIERLTANAIEWLEGQYDIFADLLKQKAPNVSIMPYEPLDFPHIYNGLKKVPEHCDQIRIDENLCWHGGTYWRFDFEPLVDRLANFNFDIFLEKANIWQDYDGNDKVDFSTYYEYQKRGNEKRIQMWALVSAECGDSIHALIEIATYPCNRNLDEGLLLTVPRESPWIWAPHLMMFLETNYQALHYADNLEELPEKIYRYKQEKRNKKGKKRTKSVIYKCRQFRINKVADDDYIETPRKTIQRKTESWGVCGHYRHYKSGKVVFVNPYIKGKREEVKPHTYIVNASTEKVGVSSCEIAR